jgi:hypothetical protein
MHLSLPSGPTHISIGRPILHKVGKISSEHALLAQKFFFTHSEHKLESAVQIKLVNK